jgi:hypothetical protein
VGKYTFQLKVMDNDGAESTDAVDVTVNAVIYEDDTYAVELYTIPAVNLDQISKEVTE